MAIVICAGALYWYGSALYQRLTRTWYWAHNIQGFVAYGAHEDQFSPDGSQVAIAFGDRCKVLDLPSGKELSRLEKYTGQGVSDFSSDGKIISRFPDDKSGGQKAYLWNASNGRMLGSINAPENESLEKCFPIFSPDGKKVVGAFAHGLVIWDSLNLKRLGQVKVPWPKGEWLPGLLAWNPANQELTAVGDDGKLLKIDLSQDTALPLLVEQQRAVRSARWSPDGTRLVTIDREDGSVAVWNVQAGTVVASMPEEDVLYASFSPGGKEVVTARKREDVVRTGRRAPPFWDRSTKIWDATTGKLLRDLPTIGIVGFSPDWTFRGEIGPEGLRIARSDGSESCYFPEWFDGHGSSCVFARDNSYLASVNGSGRVAIWRHRNPARLWIDCLTGYELWISILALIVLAWAMSGFRTWKVPAPA
ncbi:MAG: WD40 repeat domain-containing protein [Sphaerospermopsis kisseleviana]